MTNQGLHIDEFSVTDIRHLLHEAWRVVSTRRWHFVFPCCILSSIAFAVSLGIPRQYTASTVIKREHDPVFANLAGKSWMQPYEDIRSRMRQHLTEEAFIESVLAEMNLPEGLEHFDDGSLTPESARRRRSLAGAIASGLNVRNIETSSLRDVVAIELTGASAEGLSDILAAVRDQYVAKARGDTIAILRNVESFLTSESEQCRDTLAALHRRLIELELRYPGIKPDGSDENGAEQTALVVERVNLGRQRDELHLSRARLEAEAATLRDGSSAGGSEQAQPNPRYAELVAEIERLTQQIAEMRSVKGMTSAHPEVVRAMDMLTLQREELSKTPSTVAIEGPVTTRPESLARLAQVETELRHNETAIASVDARLASIGERLGAMEVQRAQAAEHRREYVKLAADAERLSSELGSWQAALAPIQNALYLENKNRSIHFATVKEAATSARPTSPDSMLVLLACVAIGLVGGGVTVLGAELLDRSFRTVKQLATSVGVPIIESIDEIVTATAARRRLMRRVILMPALAMLLVMVSVASGAIAYMSLERPDAFSSIKQTSMSAYARILGKG